MIKQPIKSVLKKVRLIEQREWWLPEAGRWGKRERLVRGTLFEL